MGDDEETKRILALLVRAPDNYMSAPRLGSTTMKLRRMTEDGLVTMSLSKKGLPFYQITPAGQELVLSDW